MSAQIISIIDPIIRPSPDDAERASKAIKMFQENLGFRETLRDYGFSMDNVKDVIDMTLNKLNYIYTNILFNVRDRDGCIKYVSVLRKSIL